MGKVRIAEKAKLKERLLKCQDVVDKPLAEFAECQRSEVDSETKHVDTDMSLWEAAACWVGFPSYCFLASCLLQKLISMNDRDMLFLSRGKRKKEVSGPRLIRF